MSVAEDRQALHETGIGARVRRVEDVLFVRGAGRYTDDITLPHQLYGQFVRSPHAHARVLSVDTGTAQSAPGVITVLTGADFAASGLGGLICGWLVHSRDGTPMAQPPHPALAAGRVRFVGEPLALVIAETAAQARDAAELVAVTYEALPATVSISAALASDAPLIHEEVPGNLCFDWEIGDRSAAGAAFAKAAHITRLDLVNNRLIPTALEPRAAIAAYDRGTDSYTLYTTSQNPHVARLVLSAFVGVAAENRLRVISPDVGGGFGSKIPIYPEETACLWASRRVGRPVKWTADRSQASLSDTHGRDHVTRAEAAFDEDGKILGLRVETNANLGAYLSTFASAVPTYLYGTLMSGQYAIPAIHARVRAGFTNTAPVDAYRGAGRPEATFVVERLMEEAARELGLDPVALRRKNFIAPDQFPYETPVIMTYDVGDYEASLARAIEIADHAGFAERRREAEARGRLRGLGFSAYIEACGIAPSQAVGQLGAGVGLWESAEIRFNPTGSVSVMTGSHSHGQGHDTTFAQIVSDRLGVPISDVHVVHGDTDAVPFGMGTYGSRSLAVGGSAIVKATDKIVEKARKVAAHLLEASAEDLEFEGGRFTVAGTDRGLTIQEAAFAAYVPHKLPTAEIEPGLAETAFYDPVNFTFPSGVHICEVEIDPETGVTEIVSFTAVDDFGEIINPMIVEGQVHGGIAQGIGQALLEGCVYDGPSGQLLTGSLMDYCVPRADNLPSFRLGLTKTPCPSNPLGAKGCGEAGAIAAPAAVINAITDAIGANIEMPATPEKVWQALRKSGREGAARPSGL